MAITRTINYTQNVPISLGFSNYLTNANTGSVEIQFYTQAQSMMGFISITPTPGVTITTRSYSTSTSSPYFTNTILTGTMADLNTALNTATFQNHLYEADTLSQDFLTQNRALPSDYRGELQIQINPNVVHGLTIGSYCRLSTSGAYYQVTKIDSVNSPTRIWLCYTYNYDISTTYLGNAQAAVGISGVTASSYLQTSFGANIAPIVDISYNNPHGDFTGSMVIRNTAGNMIEAGTIFFVGSFFIAEPTFSTLPPASIAAISSGYTSFNLGQIAQVDNNHQSVQVLMKCAMNDPQYLSVSAHSALSGYPTDGTADQQSQFVGNAINAKASLDTPRYITDTTYGVFTMVQADDLTSDSPANGVVRWHFYGTPAACNQALANLYYYRPSNNNKDFNVEVRIVNGRTRIYGSRGQ